ncbi:MAG: UDP-N-acetylglucosamine 2-epimerase (hydrolyzing) [Syntrophorhabdaceae bacterium]|nr:UDP-N-acetylglucosamine 2-epimerase (hydrolyzing) [Syntrophorhabdaceae bacterium]
MKRKICFVTSSRSDYGLLYWVMKTVSQEPQFQLQVIATGMHLSPEFGSTVNVIEDDGFHVDRRVEMLLSGDSAVAVTKSMGLGVIGFADAFADLKPDMVVVLGDRFEIFAATQAALIARIPVAHIAGGDVTEGAYDDAMRHGITKMSHLHFATNEMSAKRIRQLGEEPGNVHNVGSPGIDYIHKVKLLTRKELEDALGHRFMDKNILVTFHPATLDREDPQQQFAEVLEGIGALGDMVSVIFTKTNADTNGRVINGMIDEYVSRNGNARCFTSLGQVLYLSLLGQVDAVVGNSSSGIYEVPSFGKPTVNIGDRQKGRLTAASVINCEPAARQVREAIEKAFSMDCSRIENPYGDGQSSARIVEIIKGIQDFPALVKKRFIDLDQ